MATLSTLNDIKKGINILHEGARQDAADGAANAMGGEGIQPVVNPKQWAARSTCGFLCCLTIRGACDQSMF